MRDEKKFNGYFKILKTYFFLLQFEFNSSKITIHMKIDFCLFLDMLLIFPKFINYSYNDHFHLLDYNVTSETTDNQGEANLSTLKTTTLSPVKSDQIALLPTAEPIDNNNSVYQNYDAMCRNSSYNNRETLICDAPLNKNSDKETKEDYYNFMVSQIFNW